MDEPFAALDAMTRVRMQDELLQLWGDTRSTILFVTHSIAEAIRDQSHGPAAQRPPRTGQGRDRQQRRGHRRRRGSTAVRHRSTRAVGRGIDA